MSGLGGPLGITRPTAGNPPRSARDTCVGYARDVVAGRIPAGRWIYAACNRFLGDLADPKLTMDWHAVERLDGFFRRLSLVGESSGADFELHPWQLWTLAQIVGWRAEGRRRIRLAIVQVARGNGKTTLMAGLALWDLLAGDGRRVHVIANNEEQATICLDTARTMAARLEEPGLVVRFNRIVRPSADCEMTALPALERSLDGLNPSLWIADEAAEFKGRFLTKLLTTGAKRRESTGVIITTPGANPENHYSELVLQGEAILRGEVQDETVLPILYGLDPEDQLDDAEVWPKANPGLPFGQPDELSLRRSWNTMKRSPMGRAEFSRYHAARCDENTGGWLDMNQWPGGKSIDWEELKGRPAYIGLDLSKSLDMTACVVAVPLEGGRVALRGHYWWPKANVAERELDYRMPIRTWALENKIRLTPGREIDYHEIEKTILDLCSEFDVRHVGYDAWGSKYLAEVLQGKGVPLVVYRMGIATLGPGCNLFQNLWAGGRLVVGDDPILRRACAEADAKRDQNGNIRPVKSREYCAIDPLIASIIACHLWGGARRSIYEEEAEEYYKNRGLDAL
jgi:phage terminase large subunit-like protein